MEAYGRVDHLVNNAGTNPVFGPIAELDLGVVRKVFETNVVSALGFAQSTWAAWQRDNGGSIVNIASIAGMSASPFIGAYGVSKAAMINLTQQLAHEFAPTVRVNALAPAVVKTKFAAALYEGREQDAAAPLSACSGWGCPRTSAERSHSSPPGFRLDHRPDSGSGRGTLAQRGCGVGISGSVRKLSRNFRDFSERGERQPSNT